MVKMESKSPYFIPKVAPATPAGVDAMRRKFYEALGRPLPPTDMERARTMIDSLLHDAELGGKLPISDYAESFRILKTLLADK
jgi:hypothetical protein